MPPSRKPNHTDSVLRTNEAAGSRLELLLFRLSDRQLFGINVFKVQEIMSYRALTEIPGSHPSVCGLAHLRGRNMPIIDLARAIGKPAHDDLAQTRIIVTEHNRSVHGFLVGQVDRIVHTRWDEVLPSPTALGRNGYVNAVTRIDESLVAILDVERVFDEVTHTSTQVSDAVSRRARCNGKRVLVVDDSGVARKQIERALQQIGVECVLCHDGRNAIQTIHAMQAAGIDVAEHFAMIISDIEMPKMDGYQLTTAIRAMPALANTYILLHSSISGEFNQAMVARTGANRFIQKYCPDDLADAVLDEISDAD